MTYNDAFISARKFQFLSMFHRFESDNDCIPTMAQCRHFYKLARYHAATYVFRMKSIDLTTIPVW